MHFILKDAERQGKQSECGSRDSSDDDGDDGYDEHGSSDEDVDRIEGEERREIEAEEEHEEMATISSQQTARGETTSVVNGSTEQRTAGRISIPINSERVLHNGTDTENDLTAGIGRLDETTENKCRRGSVSPCSATPTEAHPTKNNNSVATRGAAKNKNSAGNCGSESVGDKRKRGFTYVVQKRKRKKPEWCYK